MFVWGFSAGLAAASLAALLFSRRLEDRARERAERVRLEVWAQPMPEESAKRIRDIVEGHAASIEVRGIKRLVDAMEQSRQAGEPVELKIGGETIVITPPGGES